VKVRREEYTLRRGDERGETLVEILISVVIMGLVVGAIFATYTAAARASNSQRDFVTADAELRDYAEAVQAAAQNCTDGAPFQLSAPSAPFIATSNAPATCPNPTDVVQVDISVAPQDGTPAQELTTYVRTP
jgi:type II secretory pathway pseudopilin PulG